MTTHVNVLIKEGEMLKKAILGLRALEKENKRLVRKNKSLVNLIKQVAAVGEVELSDRRLLAKLHRAIEANRSTNGSDEC